MAKTSAVASAVGGVATLSAVAVLLSLTGTSPATPAANRPTGEVTRRDLNATVSVAGQLERTDSRAVYWQQPPPATEGPQTAAAEGSQAAATEGSQTAATEGAQAAAAEGSQAAAAGGSAERQTVPAQPAAAEGTVGGAGQAQPAAPPTTSTTLPRSTTSTTTSTTSTSTTSTSTTSTSTSSTTTTTTPCTTTTTAPTMASACTTTSPPTATTPPPTSDTLAVTPAAAGVSWSVAPSAATQQEDDPSTGDGQAQDEPSSANEPADDQHTVTAVAAEGQAVERGDTLFAIDGRPTVALAGTQPAYRDLEDGVDDGGDVAQLEENLAALSYDNDGQLTVDETFDADTTAAVEAWQEARGVAATGTVALGDVAFISPTTVAATHVTVGDPVDAGGHILDVAGETVLGVGALPVRLTGEVREGSPTLVTLADGETVSGTVRSVASDATRPDGADVTESTVELTVQLDATDSPAAREGADVDLAVTTATRTGVLTVPVAAIVDAGDGQPAVRVPAGEGDDEAGQLVAVSAGVSASGYVEIADGALAEGDSMLLPGTDPEP